MTTVVSSNDATAGAPAEPAAGNQLQLKALGWCFREDGLLCSVASGEPYTVDAFTEGGEGLLEGGESEAEHFFFSFKNRIF